MFGKALKTSLQTYCKQQRKIIQQIKQDLFIFVVSILFLYIQLAVFHNKQSMTKEMDHDDC